MATRAFRKMTAIGVALAAFGAFAGTLTHSLVWDDRLLAQVIESRIGQGGVAALLRSEFTLDLNVPLGYYRPVVLLSLWADSLLAPFFPWSHHLTNVLLHVLNSVLVLLFLRQVTGTAWGPFLGALFFAAHPVHVESVAFVSGRTDLFAAFFVLAGSVAWARDRTGASARPWPGRVCGIVAFFLAALSKEAAFMLPVVLLAWDFLEPRDPSGISPGWWKRNGFWILGWGAALAFVLLLRWGVAGIGLAAQPAVSMPGTLPRVIPEASRIPALLATYFRLLVVPWPLNAYYTLSQVRFTWVTIGGALGLLGLCAATAAKEHRRAGLCGLAWILGFLLPVSGVVPLHGSVLAERFLYLPSAGMALLLCCALERPLKHPSLLRPLRASALLIAAILGVAAAARAEVWKDEPTLFRDVIKTSPSFAGGYHNLGSVYLSNGRYEEAAELFGTAIRIDGNYSDAYNTLGVAYAHMGRIDEALECFRQALRIRPAFAQAHGNMGNVLLAAGRTEDSMESFRRALRIRPDFADAYVGIGNVYRFAGDTRKAVENYRHAISLQPGNGLAHYNLALAYLALGERGAAAAEHDFLARRDADLARQLSAAIGSAR